MSKDEIKRFNDKIHLDPQLKNELKEMGTDLERVVRFANEKGFEFSMEELQELQKEDLQMSDEELDHVAGGIVGAIVVEELTVIGLGVVVN